MEKRLFGTLESGKEVYSYTISNGNLSLTAIEYGAILQSLVFRGRDLVLGYDSLGEYVRDDSSMGAVVGRCANRISGASFKINGKKYKLNANDGTNCLHGGKFGFAKVLWELDSVADESVTFRYLSSDVEEGFPGNLLVKVTYRLVGDALKIEYYAVSDKDTVVNLSNHAYFNLYEEGFVEDQFVTLYADEYTPVGKNLIPTGEILPVANTPFDFTLVKRIGKDIDEKDEQLDMARGYDHNFVIRGSGMRCFAEVSSPKSCIKMSCYTDQPSVQFYTANSLTERTGKGGKIIGRRGAFCLETQNFPDAVNKRRFPSPVLKKGESYITTTIFKFSEY